MPTHPITFAIKVLKDAEIGIIQYNEITSAIELLHQEEARIQELEAEVHRLSIAAGEVVVK